MPKFITVVFFSLLVTSCSTIKSEEYVTNLDTLSFDFLVEYDTSYFNYYNDMSRVIYIESGVSDTDISLAFYEMFLSDENDIDIIEQVTSQIKETTSDPIRQLQLAVTLVQNEIRYDHKKLENTGNWNVYYPMETLIWKKGVCSDKSLLLGKILVYMDFKICFFLFEQNNHMALGIKTNSEGLAGSGFEYIETTGSFNIGELPTSAPGQTLNLYSEQPQVIVPKYNGSFTFRNFQSLKSEYVLQNDTYGRAYSTASVEDKFKLIEIKDLENSIKDLENSNKDLENSIQSLKVKYHSGQTELFDSLNSVVNRYNENNDSLKSLIARYNQKINSLNP